MKVPVMNGIALNTVKDVFDALAEHAGSEESLEETGIFDNLMPAIVGFSNDNRVIYDYNKILEVYEERDGMTEEEAIEFIEFNTMRVLPYMDRQPIILYPPDEYVEEKEDGSYEGN